MRGRRDRRRKPKFAAGSRGLLRRDTPRLRLRIVRVHRMREQAVKTHAAGAVATCLPIAIVSEELQLAAPLCTCPKISSVSDSE